MNVFALNPYVRFSGESILSAGCVIPQRVIFDYELIYVERGILVLTYAGKEYICRAPMFLFLRPGVPHSFSCPYGEVSQPHIHFDMIYGENSEENPISYKDFPDMSPSERLRIAEDLLSGYPQDPRITFKDFSCAVSLLKSVINAFRAEDALLAKAHVCALLSLTFGENFKGCFEKKKRSRSDALVRDIKALIDTGGGLSMSLTDFSAHFSYHPTHMDKLFKEKFGMGIIAYRNQKRMQTAKRLLAEHSVTEAAFMLGFSSVYAFSRAFKNHFGASPTKS